MAVAFIIPVMVVILFVTVIVFVMVVMLMMRLGGLIEIDHVDVTAHDPVFLNTGNLDSPVGQI